MKTQSHYLRFLTLLCFLFTVPKVWAQCDNSGMMGSSCVLNAGLERAICEGDDFFLDGNAGTTILESAFWQQVANCDGEITGDMPPAVIVDPEDLKTQVIFTLPQGVACQTYYFQLVSTCKEGEPPISQTIPIHVVHKPTFDLGEDITVCPGEEVSLNALAVQFPEPIQEGLWTVDGNDGAGIFSLITDKSNPTPTFYPPETKAGSTTLVWTITTNTNCVEGDNITGTRCIVSDEITITNLGGEVAETEFDPIYLNNCYAGTQCAKLGAKFPGIDADGNSNGQWTFVKYDEDYIDEAGNSINDVDDDNIKNYRAVCSNPPQEITAPNIVNPTNQNTDVCNLIAGTYVFRWTVDGDNGACVDPSGPVDQLVYVPCPTQDVTNPGSNESVYICNQTTTTYPLVVDILELVSGPEGEEVGIWTGAASNFAGAVIANDTSPVTSVSGLVPATGENQTRTYRFTYTITNGIQNVDDDAEDGEECKASYTITIRFRNSDLDLDYQELGDETITLDCRESTATIKYTNFGAGSTRYSVAGPVPNLEDPDIPGISISNSAPSNRGDQSLDIPGFEDPGFYIITLTRTEANGEDCEEAVITYTVEVSDGAVNANAGTDLLTLCGEDPRSFVPVVDPPLPVPPPDDHFYSLVSATDNGVTGVWALFDAPLADINTEFSTNYQSLAELEMDLIEDSTQQVLTLNDNLMLRNVVYTFQHYFPGGVLCGSRPDLAGVILVDANFMLPTLEVKPFPDGICSTQNVSLIAFEQGDATQTPATLSAEVVGEWVIQKQVSANSFVDIMPADGIDIDNLGSTETFGSGFDPNTVYRIFYRTMAAVPTDSPEECDVSSDTEFQELIFNDAIAPLPANAGADQCLGAGVQTYTLQGSSDTNGMGTWSVLYSDGTTPSSGVVSFSDVTDPNAVVTFNGDGSFIFTWTMADVAPSGEQACVTTTDDVFIYRGPEITISGGDDIQEFCFLKTKPLVVNLVGVFSGVDVSDVSVEWELEGGSATGASLSDETTLQPTLTILEEGDYFLKVNVTNGPCVSDDQITVRVRIIDDTIELGEVDALCGSTSIDLGNIPDLNIPDPFPAGAFWKILSGPNLVETSISDAFSISPTINGLSTGTYVVQLLQLGPDEECRASNDLEIEVFETPNAGVDRTICSGITDLLLSGNLGDLGVWSLAEEDVTFNPNVSGTDFDNMFSQINLDTNSGLVTYDTNDEIPPGTYTFRYDYEVDEGCDFEADPVTIIIDPTPEGVAASVNMTELCDDNMDGSAFFELTGTYTDNPDITEVVTWEVISPSNNSVDLTKSFGDPADPESIKDPNTTFIPTASNGDILYGSYTLQWTVSNGSCSVSAPLVLNYNQPPSDAEVGEDIVVVGCEFETTLIATTEDDPFIGFGQWSFVSADPMLGVNDPQPQFSNVALFEPTVSSLVAADDGGRRRYTFRWTVTNRPCDEKTADLIVDVYGKEFDISADDVDLCVAEAQGLSLSATNVPALPSLDMASDGTIFSYSGIWSVVTPDANGGMITINDNTDPTSDFSVDLNGQTEVSFVLKWEVTADIDPQGGDDGDGESCIKSTEATVTVSAEPSDYIVTVEQDKCESALVVLTAESNSIPPIGSGEWTVAPNNDFVSIVDINDPDFNGSKAFATVILTDNGSSTRDFVFTWTATNGNCAVEYEKELEYQQFEPAPPAFAGPDQTSCPNSDGVATFSLSADEVDPPFTGEWSVKSAPTLSSIYGFDGTNAQTSDKYNATFSANVSGMYELEWTAFNESGDCSNSDVVVVEVFKQPDLTLISIEPNNCFGEKKGVITLVASGGEPGYSFVWSGPGIDTNNEATDVPRRDDLGVGTYSVTVTDDNGCSKTLTSLFVGEPDSPLAVDVTPTPAICFGEATGTATASVSGGTPPYFYEWSAGSIGTVQEGLAAGNYSLTVFDNKGCSVVKTFTITEPGFPLMADLEIKKQPSCGTTDPGGTLEVTINEDYEDKDDLTYSWVHDDELTGPIATGLSGGTYQVTVEDTETGCSVTLFETLQDAFGQITASVTVIRDESCFGKNDGSVMVQAYGGSGDYEFKWSDQNNTTTVNPLTRSGLGKGAYSIVIYDQTDTQKECGITLLVQIDGPDAPLSASVLDVTPINSCSGESNGSISFSVNGGKEPYEYTLYLLDDNGVRGVGTDLQGASFVEDLASGDYEIDIESSSFNSDVTCEIVTLEATIEDQLTINDLTVTLNPTSPDCTGEETGFIDLTISYDPMIPDGLQPFTYLWSNGSTDEDLTDVDPGDYSVTIFDANGCSFVSDIVTVPEFVPTFNPTVLVQDDPICGEGTDGRITISAPPGSTYEWSHDSNLDGPDATGLSAGTYRIIVRNGEGCEKELFVQLNDPGKLDAKVKGVTADFCADPEDPQGTVTIEVQNGMDPVAVTWIPQPPSIVDYSGTMFEDYIPMDGRIVFDGIPAGGYTVKIVDQSGCDVCLFVDVPSSDPIQAFAKVHNDIVCKNPETEEYDPTGSASIVALGGTPPYSYEWIGPRGWNKPCKVQSSCGDGDSYNDLPSGMYCVHVTDADGCKSEWVYFEIKKSKLRLSLIDKQSSKCYGEGDGFILVEADNGVPPYNYVWDHNGSTDAAQTNLMPGDYTVTVTDASGCTAVKTYQIMGPDSEVSVKLTNISNPSCEAGTNGFIEVRGFGGEGYNPYDYTYEWSNGGNSRYNSNLTAGTYQVVVTDPNGCSATKEFILTDPAAIVATVVSVTDADCGDSNTGSAIVKASGGSVDENGNSAYTFDWFMNGNPITASTVDDRSTANDLAPGVYSVRISDKNNNDACSVYTYLEVGKPEELVASCVVISPVGCVNNIQDPPTTGNGELFVDVTGGTTPYQYVWEKIEGSSSTPLPTFDSSSATGLEAGMYKVTITDQDGEGCSVETTCELVVPASLNAMFVYNNTSDVSCHANADGSLEVKASGGMEPYTYDWSNGLSGPSQTELSAGSYSVTVTDAKGCSKTINTSDFEVDILEPEMLTAAFVEVKEPNCSGGDGGSLKIDISGGTPLTGPNEYRIRWSTGSLDNNKTEISDLSGGIYEVTISDKNGCSVTLSQTIQDGSGINLDLIEAKDESCEGNSDGEATVGVTGDSGLYTYIWTNLDDPSWPVVETSIVSNTASISGLPMGRYQAKVVEGNDSEDQSACSAIVFFEIESPSPVNAYALKELKNCYGEADGKIVLSVSGGTAPYNYYWKDANGFIDPNQNSPEIHGLHAGNYSVNIQDANGCVYSFHNIATLTDPLPLTIESEISTNPISCVGANDGQIWVTVSGGMAPYEYSWKNEAGMEIASSKVFTSAAIDEVYSVDVTDANGCTVSRSGLSTVYDDEPLSASIVINKEPSCSNNLKGRMTVEVTPAGGLSAYDVVWNSTNFTDPISAFSINKLDPGSYTVTVTDIESGCFVTQTATLFEPPAIEIVFARATQHVTCSGKNTGSVEIQVTGANNLKANDIVWKNLTKNEVVLDDDPTNIFDIGGLAAGEYKVTVTEGACSADFDFTINEPTQLVANVLEVRDLTCDGSSYSGQMNGSIRVDATGGTPDYTYILYKDGLYEDGTPPYGDYDEPMIIDLPAGVYEIVVRDKNECTYTIPETVEIIEHDDLLIDEVNVTNQVCLGGSDGVISLEIEGGVAPYTYVWSNGGSGSQITNLPSGFYDVGVLDAGGCFVYEEDIYVGEPATDDILKVSITINDKPNCGNGRLGSLTAVVTGGSGDATQQSILWSNGDDKLTADNLSSGTYRVVVTENVLGCTAEAWVLLEDPSGLSAEVTDIKMPSCFEDLGEATVTGFGGSGNYKYEWHYPESDTYPSGTIKTGAMQDDLGVGDYFVVVSDESALITCTTQVHVEITEPNALQANVSVNNPTSCFGRSDGSVLIQVTGGTTPYRYMWPMLTNDVPDYNSPISPPLPAGNYVVDIIDANNCVIEDFAFEITEPLEIDFAVDVEQPVSCFGNNNGVASVRFVSPTKGQYSYYWYHVDPNDGLADLTPFASGIRQTNLEEGTVEVEVINSSGCSQRRRGYISQPAEGKKLTLQFVEDEIVLPVCEDGTQGQIVVLATAGTDTSTETNLDNPSRFSFVWNTGDAGPILPNLGDGTYHVVVTDLDFGCTAEGTYTFSDPKGISAEMTTTPVSCYTGQGEPEDYSDGSLAVTNIEGGSGNYTVTWKNGSGGIIAQETNVGPTHTLANRPAGEYSVTVTDTEDNCFITLYGKIATPDPIEVVEVIVDPICDTTNPEDATGQISLTVAGGTPPYKYLWDQPIYENDDEPVADKLPPGNYSVTIEDAKGCSSYHTFRLVAPDPIMVDFLFSTDVSCKGGDDGSIAVRARGGIEPYTYVWGLSSDPTFSKVGQYVTGLRATGPNEEYIVTVYDNNLNNVCIKVVGGFTISEPEFALTIDDFTVVNPSCTQGDDGSIQVSAVGGNPPYLYNFLWSNGVFEPATTESSLTDLRGGTYTVYVSDEKGCFATQSFPVRDPDAIDGEVEIVSHATCAGNDGVARVNVLGGNPETGGYEFLWDDGETLSEARNLGRGQHYVDVSRGGECTRRFYVYIDSPTDMIVSLNNYQNVSCNDPNNQDGMLSVDITGGATPYTYTWYKDNVKDDNLQGNRIANIGPGVYRVEVYPYNQPECIIEFSHEIFENVPPVLEVTNIIPASCNSGQDGQATVSVVDPASQQYTFYWEHNGSSNAMQTALAPNTDYTVAVTDNLGCSAEIVVNIPSAACEPAIGLSTQVVSTQDNGDGTQRVCFNLFVQNYGNEDLDNVQIEFNLQEQLNGHDFEVHSILSSEFYVDNNYSGIGNNSNLLISGQTLDIREVGSVELCVDIFGSGSFQLIAEATADSDQGEISDESTDGGNPDKDGNGDPGNDSGGVILSLGCKIPTVVMNTEVFTCDQFYQFAGIEIEDYESVEWSLVPNEASGVFTNNFVLEPKYYVSELDIARGYAKFMFTAVGQGGCDDVVNIVTLNIGVLNATLNIVEPDCNGEGGIVNILAIGGNGIITYTLDDETPNYTGTFTGVVPGHHTVVVSDAYGCMKMLEFDIDEPSELSVLLNKSMSDLCSSEDNGLIHVDVTGGTPPYTYNWYKNDALQADLSTPIIDNLSEGFYKVEVTDAKGCVAESEGVALTVSEVTFQASVSNVVEPSCNNGVDGSITIAVEGGTAPYIYSWNTGATTKDLSGLASGVYEVTIIDTNGCQIILSQVLNDRSGIIANLTNVMDATCSNGNNGMASVVVDGASGTYNYSWVNTGTNEEIAKDIDNVSNLEAGKYTVTVSDGNCSTILFFEIESPTPIEAHFTTVEQVHCNGANDGSISAVATGGIPPYKYTWSKDGDEESQLVGPTAYFLESGKYELVVEDAVGCQFALEEKVILEDPTPLSIVESFVTDVSCNAGTDGRIMVEVEGGVEPYSYLWHSEVNDDIISSDQVLSGVGTGYYWVTVTDANGCDASFYNMFIGYKADPLTATIHVISHPDCNGNQGGELQLEIIGGAQPFTVLWNNGATTETISDLSSGTYKAVVTDANGCQHEVYEVLTDYGGLSASVVSLSNQTCAINDDGTVSHDGSATVKAFNGSGDNNYTYIWQHDNHIGDTHNNLAGGDYYVEVLDKVTGCKTIVYVRIGVPNQIIAEVRHIKHITCFGETNGEISLDVSGGIPPYEFTWLDGQGIEVPIKQPSATLSDRPAGIYCAEITDANGCKMKTENIEIMQSVEELSVRYFIESNVTCFEGNNAIVSVQGNGGTPPYEYVWYAGATNQVQTVISSEQRETTLKEGIYQVEVIDANGCSDLSEEFTITGPSEADRLTVSMREDQKPSCNSGIDGRITAEVTGGHGPYYFDWNNGESTQTVDGLGDGSYHVVVTDANGCVADATHIFSDPAGITAQVQSTNSSCFGENNGAARVYNVVGGSGSYNYLWSNGATTDVVSDLQPGDYTITVSDRDTENGYACDLTLYVHVGLVEEMAITLDHLTDASCIGTADGEVAVSVTGGMRPYNYNWERLGNLSGNVGGNLPKVSGLSSGDYMLTVTDANGCDKVLSPVHIDEPVEMEIVSFGVHPVTCKGKNNGEATVTVFNGQPPYQFLWSNGSSGTHLDNLIAGTYFVTVTDALGCSKTSDPIEITEPSVEFNAWIQSFDNPSCESDYTGTIEIGVSGGVEPYTYEWSNGDNDPVVSDLESGLYMITVSDATGCSIELHQLLQDPTAVSAEVVFEHPNSCYGTDDGSARVEGRGGREDNRDIEEYIYLWDNGEETATAISLSPGTHTVTVSDGVCSTVAYVQIPESTPLVARVERIDEPSCSDGTNGVISLLVSGGLEPYTYEWYFEGELQGDKTDGQINSLIPGTYSVIIRDAFDCETVIEDIELEGDSEMEITVDRVQNASEYGVADGEILISVTGGTTPYTYLWNTGHASPLASHLVAGFYSVTVTDVYGCMIAEENIEITQPPIEIIVDADVSATIIQDTVRACPGLPFVIDASFIENVDVFMWSTTGSGMLTDTETLIPTYTPTDVNEGSADIILSGYSELFPDNIESDTLTIDFYDQLVLNFNVQNSPVVTGQQAEIAYEVLNGSGDYNLEWNPDSLIDNISTSFIRTVPLEGSFSMELTLTDRVTGCSVVLDDDFVIENFDPDNTIVPTNGISPNGDGINDIWVIPGIENFPDNRVIVFNRWGDEIRAFDGYDNAGVAWDGTNNSNNRMVEGTYFYVIEIANYGKLSGWIQLFK